MIECELDPLTFICKRCGFQAGAADWHVNCAGRLKEIQELQTQWMHSQPKPPVVEVSGSRLGPGTFLSQTIHSWGIPQCQSCRGTADCMNRNGSDWCEEHIEELIDKILDNASRNTSLGAKITKHFPKLAQRIAVRHLIRDSIKKSREKELDFTPDTADTKKANIVAQ